MSSAATVDPPRYHWTRQAFHRAVSNGVFSDADVQLRHGEVVRRVSPTGPRHAAVLHRLDKLLTLRLAAAGDVYDVRTEDPIARTDDDEPEPDLAVVRNRDYDDDHPGPGDIILVVEVSDTTFAADRRKVAEYAEVGLPEAWIIDVARKRVIVHQDPRGRRYHRVATMTAGSLTVAGVVVLIEEIFPSLG